jgi:hypothetical protein
MVVHFFESLLHGTWSLTTIITARILLFGHFASQATLSGLHSDWTASDLAADP